MRSMTALAILLLLLVQAPSAKARLTSTNNLLRGLQAGAPEDESPSIPVPGNNEDIFPSLPPSDELNHFNENCGLPCPDATFCGLDGQCHAYSCDAWYKLGPPFFTKYQEGSSEALSCHDDTGANQEDRTFRDQSPLCGDDWPVAVEFLTGTNNISRQCPKEGIPSISFRRKCTARPTPDTALVCYDMGSAATATSTTTRSELDTNVVESYEDAIGGRTGRHAYTLSVTAPSYGYFLPLGESSSSNMALNNTALQSAMTYSLSNSIPEDERAFGYCDDSGGCRVDEFCGRDQSCHSIDCNNLYQYGPTAMAGVQEGDSDEGVDSSELKCTLYNEVDEVVERNDTSGTSYEICQSGEWPFALKYQCSPKNIWMGTVAACTLESEPNERRLPFARRCEGRPNSDQFFLCYDMKEVLLSDYTKEYVEMVTDNPNCTEADLNYFGVPEYGDWPMCPQEEPQCVTARHEMTNRVSGDGYSTNLYWRGMSDDAFENPLNLESLDKALYSRLFGRYREDSSDPDDSSGCGTWSVITSVLLMACAVSHVW